MTHQARRYSVGSALALAFALGAGSARAEPANASGAEASRDAAREEGRTLPSAANEPEAGSGAPKILRLESTSPGPRRLIDHDVEKKAVPDEAQSGNPQRNVGYVVGGAGIVALGIGSYFGFHALSKWNERNENCVGGCTRVARSAGDDAQRAAWVSDISIALGLLATGLGSYWVLSASPAKSAVAERGAAYQARSLRVVPALDLTGAGLVLQGCYW